MKLVSWYCWAYCNRILEPFNRILIRVWYNHNPHWYLEKLSAVKAHMNYCKGLSPYEFPR